jgi:hypothetical protein
MVLGFVLCQHGTAQNFNKAIEGRPDVFTAVSIEKLSTDSFLIFQPI